jgi:SM-20-related protein
MEPFEIVSDEAFEKQTTLIIDGLAEEGYAVIDNFVNEEEIQALLARRNELEEQDAFKKAGIGNQNQFQLNKKIRGDYIRWIEEDTEPNAGTALLSKMRKVMEALNRYCFLGLKDLESHFAVYPAGTGYQRHSDCFKQNAHRVVSFVLYMNEGWKEEDGGQLKIYFDDKEDVVVNPLAGRLVCFRSEIEHEVLLAHRERNSITGWMLSQLKELTYL